MQDAPPRDGDPGPTQPPPRDAPPAVRIVTVDSGWRTAAGKLGGSVSAVTN